MKGEGFPVKLTAYMERHRLRWYADVADDIERAVGFRPANSTISCWKKGHRTPDKLWRAKIEEVLDG